MERERSRQGHRPLLAIAAVALLAGGVQARDTGTPDPADFDTSFAPLAVDPAPHDHPSSAVDLTAIEPPIEQPASSVSETLGSGRASFYGKRFHGRRTASGEAFDMHAMTAAHRTLPFGSMVRVTNRANGRSVVVRINDRGPFHGNRVIDVSRAAATELGLIGAGSGEVTLELLSG